MEPSEMQQHAQRNVVVVEPDIHASALGEGHTARGSRGRGRGGRGRGRGRGGRGRGRGDGGAPLDDGETADAVGTVDARDGSGGATAAPADAEGMQAAPPKKESKRSKDRKKKKAAAEAAETGDAVGGEKPKRVVPERTPAEKLIHAIRVDDRKQFDAILAEFPDLDVNTPTKSRDVVLVEACRYARVGMVKTLVQEKRADVNKHAMNEKGGRKQLRPLHAAVMTLREDLVNEILNAPGQVVDLAAIYDVAMPATIAVFFCVANGYTKEQQDKAISMLKTLLDHAKSRGEAELKKVLNTETSKGNRLVHIAVMLANYEAVETLQKFGADFSVANATGLSPLQLIENNAFHRRSFTISRLPLRSEKQLPKKQSRKRKSGDAKAENDANANDVDGEDEPESAAEVELKVNSSVKRLDRDVENDAVLRTLLPLIDLYGLGPLFSRKGNDGIRSIHIKGLVLAHVGILPVMNKIVALPAGVKSKDVYIDGVMHCVSSLQGLSMKNDSQFGKLWTQSFVTQSNDECLLPEATLLKIIDTLLEHKSLSRRVKVWTMILVRSLGLFDRDEPMSKEEVESGKVPVSVIMSARVFERISEAIFRSGCKMLFSIFDRTEIDEDESYDEELEFHLLLALTELFFQLFVPLSRAIGASAATEFARVTSSIKKLWELLVTALASLNETFSSPQRFSLVLHVLQVFEVVEHALNANGDEALLSLFKTVKRFGKQEAEKKRIVRDVSKQVQLLHNISAAFPMAPTLLEKIIPLKDKLDLLLRSDAKILGLDLYAFARQENLIRLEHKVDYLEVLSEEQSGSVNITISRTSNANYVDFILQQILSTSAQKMKGELDVALVDEPGVGAGVVREFFQIIQHTFFHPLPLEEGSVSTSPPNANVTEIGSQWLQMARAQSPRRTDGPTAKGGKRGKTLTKGDILRFFPLFEHVEDMLRITPRPLRVPKTVIDGKQPEAFIHLGAKDLFVNEDDVKAMKQLYLCAGRLLGLAIRDQQPLDANFPIAFWKFMLFERISWEEYCGSNDVFKRSLQFLLDHDFDASPMDLFFEYTADVEVVDADGASPLTPTSIAMVLELPGSTREVAVTNANKAKYVEARAKQYFFKNEFEYYKKMRDGLSDTILKADLKLFSPAELQRVVRGDREIDLAGLRKSVIYSRGLTEANEVVRNFWEVVETFDQSMKEKLLTFWSGSELPPLFGFHSSSRTNPHATYWYFDLEPSHKSTLCPTANTCDRRLMLPPYPTKEALREKLLVALEHGAVGYDRM